MRNRIRRTHDKPRPRLLRGRSHRPHGGFRGTPSPSRRILAKMNVAASVRQQVRPLSLSSSHGRQPPPLALTSPHAVRPILSHRARRRRPSCGAPGSRGRPDFRRSARVAHPGRGRRRPYSRRPGKIPPAAGCAFSSRRGAASPRRRRGRRSKRARGRSSCSAPGSTRSPIAWREKTDCACSRSIIPQRKPRSADGSRRPASRRRPSHIRPLRFRARRTRRLPSRGRLRSESARLLPLARRRPLSHGEGDFRDARLHREAARRRGRVRLRQSGRDDRDPASRELHERLSQRVAAAGEAFRSYFETPVLHEKLRALGFGEIEDLGPNRIAARYFPERARRGGLAGGMWCARGGEMGYAGYGVERLEPPLR